eukprot:1361585-Amorphochlora_amoeboformis.AAC.1
MILLKPKPRPRPHRANENLAILHMVLSAKLLRVRDWGLILTARGEWWVLSLSYSMLHLFVMYDYRPNKAKTIRKMMGWEGSPAHEKRVKRRFPPASPSPLQKYWVVILGRRTGRGTVLETEKNGRVPFFRVQSRDYDDPREFFRLFMENLFASPISSASPIGGCLQARGIGSPDGRLGVL